MIDQSFGYPAIERRLLQIAQADFPRTPFTAGVVQGAVKFRCGSDFCFSVIATPLHDLWRSVDLDTFATPETIERRHFIRGFVFIVAAVSAPFSPTRRLSRILFELIYKNLTGTERIGRLSRSPRMEMVRSLLIPDREIEYFSPGVWEIALAGNETQIISDFSIMRAIGERREVLQYFHFAPIPCLIVNCHCRYGNLVDKSTCRVSTDGCGIGSNLVRRELAAFS